MPVRCGVNLRVMCLLLTSKCRLKKFPHLPGNSTKLTFATKNPEKSYIIQYAISVNILHNLGDSNIPS